MKSFGEILYEVNEALAQYQEHGVIDEDTLRTWAIRELKTFGPLVMVPKNQVIFVHNYTANKPMYLYDLRRARRCGFTRTEVISNPPSKISQTVMKIREEIPLEQIGQQEFLDPDGKYRKITETFLLETPNSVRTEVMVGGDMEIVSSINTNVCGVSEMDKSEEFRITGNKIASLNNTFKTDFKEGVIYIEYLGLPEDENGELLIKDDGNGYLEKLILYTTLREAFTYLWVRYNVDVVTRMNRYTQLAEETKPKAMVSLKSDGLVNGEYIPVIKKKNVKRLMVYRNVFK